MASTISPLLTPASLRRILSPLCALALALAVPFCPAGAAAPPSVEFDVPYQVKSLAGGSIIELSGSFSWALPQSFAAVLAASPAVRVIRLESPGGHVAPAMEVADIIRQRGLNTYVGRLCASACTLAFLGGRQRWIGPQARLGFHQARAPGFPAEQANALLLSAYRSFTLPAPFIAHVLKIPASDLWNPSGAELKDAGLVTGNPPDDVLSLDEPQLPRLTDLSRRLPMVADTAVVTFAAALLDLIGPLQQMSPEACWAFAHEAPDLDPTGWPGTVLAALAAVQTSLAGAAAERHATVQPDAPTRRRIIADLLAAVRARGDGDALAALRPGADHAGFCPSLHTLLQAALAMPEGQRAATLRALMSGK